MTAFLSLLNTYAIWIYLAGVVVILFGIKMLLDARRAGRTTLFTLEQEQAGDRAFRAVLVMGVATLAIAAVAGINAFVTPAVPTPDDASVTTPTVAPYTPPVILPTATELPTETPLPTTPAPTTVAVAPTSSAPVAPTVAITATKAAAQPTATAAPTAPPATPTSALLYPAVPLNTPPNGDSIGASNIRFSWGMNTVTDAYDVPQELPPDQWYQVTVSYNSKSQGKVASVTVCLHGTSVDRKTGFDLTDYRSDSADSVFNWRVTIVRAESQQACEAGNASALSPSSAPSAFRLP